MAKPKALSFLISKRRKMVMTLKCLQGQSRGCMGSSLCRARKQEALNQCQGLLSLAGILVVSLVVLARDILREFSATPGSNARNVSGFVLGDVTELLGLLSPPSLPLL